jgi:hypothetical protein
MHELLPIIRRMRRPLIQEKADMPKVETLKVIAESEQTEKAVKPLSSNGENHPLSEAK